MIVCPQDEERLVNTADSMVWYTIGKKFLKLVNKILENDRQDVLTVVHILDRDEEIKRWIDQQIQLELGKSNNL